MIITQSKNQNHIIFLPEDINEDKKLSKFPGFIKIEKYYTCPKILPVAYNLFVRCKKEFKKLDIVTEVQAWLNSEFKLTPLPDTFKFHTTPQDFQSIALRYLYTLGSAGILLDPGMGKSKVVLDYIFLKQFDLSLIVCPYALLFVWEDEIFKHRPELDFYVVKSTDWEKELAEIQKLQGNKVVIINYSKVVLLKHRLKELMVDYIHLDEFLIKDPKTNRTNSILELSKGIEYKSGGSGTLINNSPMDAYCPIKFLQPGIVGPSYLNFFNKYAVTKDVVINKGTAAEQSRRMVVNFKGRDEIRSMLESCSIVMTKERWLKLPPKEFYDINVQMSQEQKELYFTLLKQKIAQIGDLEVKVDNTLTLLSKLHQISQGFIYTYEESEEEITSELLANDKKVKKKQKLSDRITIYFKEQPKIQALRDLLTNKLKNTKCIIWFNLSAEFELIEKLLKELGDTYLVIKGGEKHIGDKVRSFNKDPSILRLVCQAKSVNYGITILGSKEEDLEKEGILIPPDIDPSVCNQVFYSLNFSLEVYLQQQDRIHRLGQTNTCHYYRIFCNNPTELTVKQAIADKITLKEEMLIDFAENLLQKVNN